MKFLFHLTRVFRFLEDNGRYPKVKFQKIPTISNPWLNSRTILALLAFILLPEKRSSLLYICRFISYTWADHWFSDQLYNADSYQNLCNSLQANQKALITMQKFWNREPSALNIQRSNQCAERAIMCLQMLYGEFAKRRINWSLDLFYPMKPNYCMLLYLIFLNIFSKIINLVDRDHLSSFVLYMYYKDIYYMNYN